MMEKFALLARVEAKPGMETSVENFLKEALPLAQAEPNTMRWYGLKISDNTFGIFDTFETEAGRSEHLQGQIAKAIGSETSNTVPWTVSRTRCFKSSPNVLLVSQRRH